MRTLAGTGGYLFSLTAGQGVFDQVVDVVESRFVDGLLDFVESRRLGFEEDHDGGFDGRAAGFHTGTSLTLYLIIYRKRAWA